MDANNKSAVLRPGFCRRHFLFALCTTLIAITIAAPAARATLITFDDLEQATCEPEPGSESNFCDPLYVTDQYQHLGVTFYGAALNFTYGGSYDPRVSMPNFISDFWGPGMDIYFSGALPTTVSMYLTAQLKDQLTIAAFAADGSLITTAFTSGMTTHDPDFHYQPRQLITLTGGEIAHLRLDELYLRRGTMTLDDFSFTRDPLAVAEPSTLLLILGGLLASLFARSIAPRRFL